MDGAQPGKTDPLRTAVNKHNHRKSQPGYLAKELKSGYVGQYYSVDSSFSLPSQYNQQYNQ
jgi:hypothetical protein